MPSMQSPHKLALLAICVFVVEFAACATELSQCGNAVMETGEACDDGNVIARDGCTNCEHDITVLRSASQIISQELDPTVTVRWEFKEMPEMDVWYYNDHTITEPLRRADSRTQVEGTAAVLSLKNATLLPCGALQDSRGIVARQHSAADVTSEKCSLPVYCNGQDAPCVTLQRYPIVLNARALVGDSFFHFVTETLRDLEVLSSAAPTALKNGVVIISEGSAAWADAITQLFGIPRDRIIESSNSIAVHGDVVMYTEFTSRHVLYPAPSSLHRVADALAKAYKTVQQHRNVVYIQSQNATRRAVQNELQLIHILEEIYGSALVVCKPTNDFGKAASVFSKASVIIGMHGSALTNMLFSAPNATIVELMPATNPVLSYVHLSNALNHRHFVLWLGGMDMASQQGYVDLDMLRHFLARNVLVPSDSLSLMTLACSDRRMGLTEGDECRVCPAGSYRNAFDGVCHGCPLGSFSTKEGSIECNYCASQSTTSKVGSVQCEICVGLSADMLGSSSCIAVEERSKKEKSEDGYEHRTEWVV